MTDDKRSKTPTLKTHPEAPKAPTTRTSPPLVTSDIPPLPPMPGQAPQGSRPPSKPQVSLDTDKGIGPPTGVGPHTPRQTPAITSPGPTTPRGSPAISDSGARRAVDPFVTSPERPIVRKTPVTDPLGPRDSMDEALTSVFDSGQFPQKPKPEVSVSTSEETNARRRTPVSLDTDEDTNAMAKRPQPQNLLNVMVEDSIRPRPLGGGDPFADSVRPRAYRPNDFGDDSADDKTRPGYLSAGEPTEVQAGPSHAAEPEAHDTFNMLDVVVDKTGVRAAQQAPATDVDAPRPVVAGLAAARSAGPDAVRHAGAGPDSVRPYPMAGPGPDSVRPVVLAQSRKAIDDSGDFRREVATPVKAVSRKENDDRARPRADTPPRAIPQVQLRALSDVKGHAPQGQNLGNFAPPRDRGEVRARRGRELVIWGSVVVMIACVVALVIWFLAQ